MPFNSDFKVLFGLFLLYLLPNSIYSHTYPYRYTRMYAYIQGGAFLKYYHNYTTISCLWLFYILGFFRLLLGSVYLYVCGYRYTHMHTIFLGLYYSIYLYVYKYKYTHMHTIYWGLYLSGNALTSGLLFLAFWFLIEYLAIN